MFSSLTAGEFLGEKGKSSSAQGNSPCKVCANGKHASVPGQAACVDCEIGKSLFNKHKVNYMYEECDVCGQNSYQTETGQLSCKSCQDKKINDLGTDAGMHDHEDDCTATGDTCADGSYQLKNSACEVSSTLF